MDDWESLKNEIEKRARAINDEAMLFRTEMTALVEEAKNNAILNTLKSLNGRLSVIEQRLQRLPDIAQTAEKDD